MQLHPKLYIAIVTLVLVAGVYMYVNNNISPSSSASPSPISELPPVSVAQQNVSAAPTQQDFLSSGLMTNTAKSSIPLEKVLDGGPGKDGIPALTNPAFVSVDEATSFLKDDMEGILVTVGKTTRFYPYNIMVWHEIVNDSIEGRPLTVTFCPLCGSAIVFDAKVLSKSETFGVSGKLYESNLLMYDKTTESLWSQIQGEAVVGKMTGTKLSLYPSQVLPFQDIKARYAHAKVLSAKTGYSRDYGLYPYGDYAESEDVYFPVSVSDKRLPAKEKMYIVQVGTHSVALKLSDLQAEPASIAVGATSITAVRINREVEVRSADGTLIPGYYAMWFSWATHHEKDGIVWKK